ncbi:MAG: hypothetical protein MUC96_24895 [Myxococcaceae bacterium]|nr:hypothetical protein [Myxococcaceae bacterium]
MKRALAVAVVAAACACEKPANVPVCGLHSAAAPLLMLGTTERPIAVGSKLGTLDEVKAQGPTLLECFGGALKVLEKGDRLVVGTLKEAKIVATTLPRYELRALKLVKLDEAPPMAMAARYSDTRYTPRSALESDEPTSGDYLRAFFTPDGLSKLGQGARADGPRKLPPPSQRVRVPSVHAGPLGLSTLRRLEVEDEFVFAESDELATAVMLEDEIYDLAHASRLVLPDGAEATLVDEGQRVELEGPMDLRLR